MYLILQHKINITPQQPTDINVYVSLQTCAQTKFGQRRFQRS